MNQAINDPYASVEAEMGFGGGSDNPNPYLRLKESGDTEVVTLKSIETVEANQKELENGWHKEGKTVKYTFTSPITGEERTHRASGQSLMIGLKNSKSYERDAAGFNLKRKVMPEETCRIVREGTGGETRMNVEILSPEELTQYIKENTYGAAHSDLPSTTAPQQQESPPDNIQNEETVRVEDIPF